MAEEESTGGTQTDKDSGNKKVGVLVVHGMGTQEDTYAKKMIDELKRRLGDGQNQVAWKPVFWADILSERQKAYLKKAEERSKEKGGDRFDWVWAREFVMNSLSDAVSYRYVQSDNLDNPETTYGKIHQRVRDGLKELGRELVDDGKLVVLAHSLGGHIVSNYIWDVQNGKAKPKIETDSYEGVGKLRLLVTFGCNIPLFTFALEKVEPICLGDEVKWDNYYDKDDILGYPLQPIGAYEKICEDIEINVGGFLSSWNMFSHVKYWTDNDFTKPVAESIREVIR